MSRSTDMAKLVVSLEVESARLQKDLDKANRKLGAFGKQVDGTVSKASLSFNKLGASVAAFASIGALGLATKRSLDFADSIGKLHESSGFSIKTLQELRFAASQSGMSVTGLDAAVNKFNKRLGLMRVEGGGAAASIYKKIGIDLDQDYETVFRQVVDGMAKMERQSDRAALATKFFGDEAQKMELMLRGGTAGLDLFAERAHALGLVLGDELVKNAEKANDELSVMKQVTDMQVTKVFVNLAPAVFAAGNAFEYLSGRVAGVTGAVRTFAEWAAAYNADQITFDEFFSFDTSEQKTRLDELKKRMGSLSDGFDKPPKSSGDGFKLGDGDGGGNGQKDNLSSINAVIAALEKQAATYGMSKAQLAIYNLEALKATPIQIENAKAYLHAIGALEDKTAALKAADEALDAQAQSQLDAIEANKEFRSAIIDLVDPVANYREEMLELQLALELYPELVDQINVKMMDLESNMANATGASNGLDNALGKQKKGLIDLKKAHLDLVEAISDARNSTGALTDMEALREQEGFARRRIELLREEIATVKAMGGGSIEAAIKVKELQAEIANVSKELELVADKFRASFEDAFADGFENIMNGSKDFGEALKDVFNDIVRDINKMVARELSQELMKLLGGGLEPGTGAGLFGFLGNVIFPDGETAIGPTSFFSTLFGGIAGRAIGGPVTAGVPYIVGERGPELFVPRSSGNIEPNNRLGGSTTIINNITVQSPQGRIAPESMAQLQTRVGAATQRALRRNG